MRMQCGADAERAKHRKRVKNADNAEKPRTVQEKRTSAAELSPVDPTDVICFSWTRSGEIRSTGLLLTTFNKVHILELYDIKAHQQVTWTLSGKMTHQI